MSHPIRRPEVQADIERWTEILLSQTGSAEIEVTLVFNVHDRRFVGLRLGGSASRRILDPAMPRRVIASR